MSQEQRAENMRMGRLELAQRRDGSWRIYAPQSTTIDLRDCAGKWLMSFSLKGGNLEIVGSPAQKRRG
jgi:hypothetical protein